MTPTPEVKILSEEEIDKRRERRQHRLDQYFIPNRANTMVHYAEGLYRDLIKETEEAEATIRELQTPPGRIGRIEKAIALTIGAMEAGTEPDPNLNWALMYLRGALTRASGVDCFFCNTVPKEPTNGNTEGPK